MLGNTWIVGGYRTAFAHRNCLDRMKRENRQVRKSIGAYGAHLSIICDIGSANCMTGIVDDPGAMGARDGRYFFQCTALSVKMDVKDRVDIPGPRNCGGEILRPHQASLGVDIRKHDVS